MSYEFILVEPQVAPFVAKIQLNRPKELNALNLQLMGEIRDALLVDVVIVIGAHSLVDLPNVFQSLDF